MERKQVTHPRRQNKLYATLLGVFFKSLLILMMINIISWLFLIIFFGTKVLFSIDAGTVLDMNKILSYQLSFIHHYYPYFDKAVQYLESYKNLVESIISYITNPPIYSIITIIVWVSLEIIVTRCIIFLMSVPFLLVILILFFIDGLVQRDVRKYKGERESALFFHRIKPLIFISFILIFCIYMSIPFLVSPQFVLFSMVFISGFFTLLTIKSFKKYM
jgi:hypothetical protein